MSSDKISTPDNEHHYKKAAFYSIAAYFIMALGIVAWKCVIASYGIAQILALEALVCLPLFVGMAQIRGGLYLLKTSYPFLQILRGILQTMAAYIGLYGLLHLPVSTYTMLEYCTPFVLTVAAWIFLKEKCGVLVWVFVAIGFIGTALIIQPEYTRNYVAAFAVIFSCCFWAANVILMRRMTKDHVISFPFYTVLICGLVSFMIVLFQGFKPMPMFDFSMITIAGFFFFIGSQILFASYRLSPLYYLTPFQYTQIVWILLLSYFIWSETLTLTQIIGLALVIAASVSSAFLKKDA